MADLWVLTNGDAYTNLGKSFSLFVLEDAGLWYIDAFLPEDRTLRQARLKGSWATKAEGLEAVRRLVDGLDPSTY